MATTGHEKALGRLRGARAAVSLAGHAGEFRVGPVPSISPIELTSPSLLCPLSSRSWQWIASRLQESPDRDNARISLLRICDSKGIEGSFDGLLGRAQRDATLIRDLGIRVPARDSA